MARVAILGTGLIGSSIGLRLKQSSEIRDLEVIGHDRAYDAAQYARKIGAVDLIERDPAMAVRDAALVILAAPVLANHRLMADIANALPDGAIVTDTGSTKAETMREAERVLPDRVSFIGGHPMAGKTESGPKHADAALFEGARWVVVPETDAPESAIEAVLHVARSAGAEPMFMDAEEHDAYAAAISHLPLLMSVALFRLARSSEAWPEMSLLAAGGFKEITRLAATDPSMSFDIASTNREQIAHWIDRLRETLREVRDYVTDKSHEENLFKLLAQSELEYGVYRGGKVGREVESGMQDVSGFDFGSFLMGEALREKMREITRDQEERMKRLDQEQRSRRNV
jgi:prephenate dehydrogenase